MASTLRSASTSEITTTLSAGASPSRSRSALKAVWMVFSGSLLKAVRWAKTPRLSSSRRRVWLKLVKAKMGTRGWQLVTESTVAPRRVITTMPAAPRASAKCAAAVARCCLSVLMASASCRAKPRCRSLASAMAASCRTQRTGYSPTLVSPESMIASAPSYTALATSVTSARVGRGFSIIDSSRWVATTQRLPRRAQVSTRRRCTIGRAAMSVSMPRSPRATITPSAAAVIASALRTPS